MATLTENRSRRVRTTGLGSTVAGLVRDPLGGFERIGRASGGDIVRVNLGLFRPYVVTRPEHVQHVLRDNVSNYVRGQMLWKPLRPLIGDGISGDGPVWEGRRRLIQPMFAAPVVARLTGQLSDAIGDAVDELGARAARGRPLDAGAEMTRIIHRALVTAFFGGRISGPDAHRLATAVSTAFTSLGSRMLLPFMPGAVPLPGDRAYRRAVRTVDEVMFPVVRECRAQAGQTNDVVSLLCQARDDQGIGLDDRQVRDDIVAMFVAGTETTAMAMTWLWVALAANPDVEATLRAEIDSVVGGAQPGPEHVPHLHYTRLVIQELLRLYPPAWIMPRTVRNPDTIDGVRLRAKATVLLSPYLTQRMERIWDRPNAFDPTRFSPERSQERHRYAYFPFSGGPHQCLGAQLVTLEAQLIIATLLSRFRTTLVNREPVRAQAAVTLRPRQKVRVRFQPFAAR